MKTICCDNCFKTQESCTLEKCILCDTELCEDCLDDHYKEDHLVELIDHYRKTMGKNG
jgi:hypothetical protein